MWLRSSSIPLDEHGSKIRKVIRCRPTVSNEIILATRQEFFYTRVLSSRKKYNWHCVIAFLINAALLNVYFTLQYHLFFRKETYFFECYYFSEYDIRMSLYTFFGWKRDYQFSKYATVHTNHRWQVDFSVQKLGLFF